MVESSCPLCRSAVNDDRKVCKGCDTLYHHACLAELGGCGTVGCPRFRKKVAKRKKHRIKIKGSRSERKKGRGRKRRRKRKSKRRRERERREQQQVEAELAESVARTNEGLVLVGTLAAAALAILVCAAVVFGVTYWLQSFL